MSEPVTDNLREYIFSDDGDEVAYDTLEFRHPAFAEPARVVNSNEDLMARLESDAPANAGEEVKFTRCLFEVTLPESSAPGLPQCQLAMANVGRVLMDPINQAVEVPAPIEVTYRQFVTSDLTEPGQVVDGMTIGRINASEQRITATAGFEDDLNAPGPRKLYTPQEYPGLVR
jgi:hypothetical protein